MSEAGALRCYACGQRYGYLGREPHPGRCPRCDSHCVSPAGRVSALAALDVDSSSDPAETTVVAIDERRRHYLYHFATVEGGAELVALQVEGHVVRTENVESPLPVPPTVRRTLAQTRGVSASLPRGATRCSRQ